MRDVLHNMTGGVTAAKRAGSVWRQKAARPSSNAALEEEASGDEASRDASPFKLRRAQDDKGAPAASSSPRAMVPASPLMECADHVSSAVMKGVMRGLVIASDPNVEAAAQQRRARPKRA